MPQSKPMKWLFILMYMQKIILITFLGLILPMILMDFYFDYKNKKKLKKW